VQFGRVFPGEAVRALEVDDECHVEHILRPGVPQLPHGGDPRCRKGGSARQHAERVACSRPGDADDWGRRGVPSEHESPTRATAWWRGTIAGPSTCLLRRCVPARWTGRKWCRRRAGSRNLAGFAPTVGGPRAAGVPVRRHACRLGTPPGAPAPVDSSPSLQQTAPDAGRLRGRASPSVHGPRVMRARKGCARVLRLGAEYRSSSLKTRLFARKLRKAPAMCAALAPRQLYTQFLGSLPMDDSPCAPPGGPSPGGWRLARAWAPAAPLHAAAGMPHRQPPSPSARTRPSPRHATAASVAAHRIEKRLAAFYRLYYPQREARVPVIVAEFVRRGGGDAELAALNEELRQVCCREVPRR